MCRRGYGRYHFIIPPSSLVYAFVMLSQVASTCLDSSLLKYSAKEYFFRAALCHLCVDLLNAQHALEKYSQQYPAFQDSREYKLVKVSCNGTIQYHRYPCFPQSRVANAYCYKNNENKTFKPD